MKHIISHDTMMEAKHTHSRQIPILCFNATPHAQDNTRSINSQYHTSVGRCGPAHRRPIIVANGTMKKGSQYKRVLNRSSTTNTNTHQRQGEPKHVPPAARRAQIRTITPLLPRSRSKAVGPHRILVSLPFAALFFAPFTGVACSSISITTSNPSS